MTVSGRPIPSLRRLELIVMSAALVAVSAACRQPARAEFDLLSRFPVGVLQSERSVIDVGRADEPDLESGWSHPEEDAKGRSFRWALGRESGVTFWCTAARDLEFEIQGRPFEWPGAPDQGVRLRLNGDDLGWKPFGRSEPVRFELPATGVRIGTNTLELQWDRATRPKDVRSSRDRRELAVAVESLVIAGLEDSQGHADSRVLPAASELSVWAWADEGSALRVRFEAGGGENLAIWARQDGRKARRLCGPCSDAGSMDLGTADGPVEIGFRTMGKRSIRVLEATVLRRPAPVAKEIRARGGSSKPDILLYVVDTLRADQLGCYGGPAGVSPALDRLAEDGVVFERAVAQSSWTKPSVVSMLSGRLTTEHGVRSREPEVPASVEMMAEWFQAAGYRTGALTANAYLVEAAGFDRGFDTFEFEHRSAESLTRRAIRWLDRVDPAQPVFLWIHTIDPHAPYEPEPDFRRRFAPEVPPDVGTFDHVRSLAGQPEGTTAPFVEPYLELYRAEIAQNDAAFGAILEAFRREGRYDEACVVFVSDHGEGFWDHGVNGHGWDLFEEVLHVPLVLKLPDSAGRGRRVVDPVQHIDLAPTLLRLAGIVDGPELSGRDLFSPRAPDAVVFSEMTYEGREGFAVRRGSKKLIQPLSANFLPSPRLFDLERDPGEAIDRSGDLPVTAAWMAQEGRKAMRRLQRAAIPGGEVELTTDQRRALEAMGYLDPEG